MRQVRFLCFPRVLDEAAGSLQGGAQIFAIEGTEVAGIKMFGEDPGGILQLELPNRSPAFRRMIECGFHLSQLFLQQNLGRLDATYLGGQRVQALYLAKHESAAADIHEGNAIGFLRGSLACARADGEQAIIAALVQQGLIAHRSRCDDSNNLSLYRALAGSRVADLLTDGDGYAGLNQLRQIAIRRMVGDAAHGYGLAAGFAAGGECNVQNIGGGLGVFKEQLVEVAHAIKQQTVLVLSLDAQKLLHHRSVCLRVGQLANC
jgi:hypothetical protein